MRVNCEECNSKSRHRKTCSHYRPNKVRGFTKDDVEVLRDRLRITSDEDLGVVLCMVKDVIKIRMDLIRSKAKKSLAYLEGLGGGNGNGVNRRLEDAYDEPSNFSTVGCKISIPNVLNPPSGIAKTSSDEIPATFVKAKPSERVCGARHPDYFAIRCKQKVDRDGKHLGDHHNPTAMADAKTWSNTNMAAA